MKNGPRVRSFIKFNVSYDDGELLSKEAIEGGVVRQYQEYCHVEFTNIGKLPTTLIGLIASSKAENNTKDDSIVKVQTFTPHWAEKLPFFLKPGEIWSYRTNIVDCQIAANQFFQLRYLI